MESPTESIQNLDYTAAIEDLKRKAKRSRIARLYIAVGLLILMSLAVAAVFSSSQSRIHSLGALGEKISFDKMRDPGLFLRKSNDLLEKIYPDSIINLGKRLDGEDVKEEKFTADERAAYMRELEQLVKFYERTQTAYSKQPFAQKTPDWTSSVSSMAFTFGAIAVSILLFQTAVSFIRYYSQLAELYDSQASALLAADNDLEKFVKYSEMLSPSAVSFGKPPVSVYERAFEAIASIRGKDTK